MIDGTKAKAMTPTLYSVNKTKNELNNKIISKRQIRFSRMVMNREFNPSITTDKSTTEATKIFSIPPAINSKLKFTNPKPGDIFIMDYGKGLGHTGFVVEVLSNGNLKTIEGNTNDEGSSEGYEVCYRIRKQSQIKGYIRILN